jgi:hypothetical protein
MQNGATGLFIAFAASSSGGGAAEELKDIAVPSTKRQNTNFLTADINGLAFYTMSEMYSSRPA